MQTAPSQPIIEDDSLDRAVIAEARADLAAGRYVSGEAVKRWLRSWGKPDELPPPKLGD